MSHALFDLLRELEAAGFHYALARHRPDTVMVTFTLVGERVEAVVFDDGHIEVSRFKGDESIEGGMALINHLIAENRD
jgi:hypothetical protein